MPRSRYALHALLIGVLAWASAARAGAQQAAPPDGSASTGPACAGETVTAVDIHVYPATSIGALEGMSPSASQTVRSRFSRTRADVVKAYLRVKVGQVCTEVHRAESERLLRAQPFSASAAVRAIPDGPGRVRLQVDVVDEQPFVADGGLSRGKLASLMLGTLNLQGRGLTVTVRATRGFAYRNGFGIHVAQYGMFGAPYYVAAGAERNTFGEALSFEFAEPFLTELQRRAFRAGAREVSEYYGVVRPAGSDVSLMTRRVSYDMAWVTRVGTLDRHHVAGFVGAALIGEDTRIGDSATFVSDTGLVRVQDATFGTTYPNYAIVRVAAIAGLRSIHFMTVRGFDALKAQQDIGAGIQIHLLAGPSVWAAEGRGEAFAAADLYGGIGHENSFMSAHIVSEVRANYNAPKWGGVVTSGRLSWYDRPTRLRTRVVSLNFAALRHLDFPAQLTFRDADGGVAGFSAARAAGGSRAVVRVEERRLFGLFGSRADFAVAGFADAGKLWAGDVPYGQTTTIRASLGLSLLAAYPSGGKRTYRLDVAFPVNPERGDARVELRVSALDRTRLLWLEPRDVWRVRTGAVPATLMKW